MSISESTQPFSLTIEHNRNGANGFTRPQGSSEFVDNTFDADGHIHFHATIPPASGFPKGYHIIADRADGVADLRSLYGIGHSVVKKRAGKRGLKNYGHTAAVGRFNPSCATHISRHRGSLRANTLRYNLGITIAAIDAAKRAGTCDYRQIDRDVVADSTFQYTTGGLTDEVREFLSHLLARVSGVSCYTEIATMISNILSNGEPHFLFTVFEYDTFPAEMIDEIKDAMKSFRRDYYHALIAGRSIHYMTESEAAPICADETNAIDPMGSASQFPRLVGHSELRVHPDSSTTMMKFTLSDPSGQSKVFYLKHRDGDKIWFNGNVGAGPFMERPPPNWDVATPIGDDTGIHFACSVVSKAEEYNQKSKTGSHYNSVDDMRGVNMRFHDRIMGAPIYNEAEWESKRNVGGLRVELHTTDVDIAEGFFNTQTKKHSANFDGLHPLIRLFLNWIVQRVIISRFSKYNAVAKNGMGITAWNFTYFCALMLNAKAKDPSMSTPPPSQPVVIPRPPASPISSVSSSVTSGASSVASLSDNEDGGGSNARNLSPIPLPSTPFTPAPARVVPITKRKGFAQLQDILTLLKRHEALIQEGARTADNTKTVSGLAPACDSILTAMKLLGLPTV